MSDKKFIDIKALIASKSPKLAKWLPGFVIRYLKRILHQDEINAFIAEHKEVYNADFCEAVVNYFNITIRVEGIENIPKEGPVIITMNHPLGGMDALALVTALKDHRTDVKFIVNDLLMNMENLRDLFVGVNKHGKNDLSVREQISRAFESNDVICIFPAGLVSRKVNGRVMDLDWKKTFVTYAKKYHQPIVPIHIDGKLSNFFYRLSNFRKRLGIKVNIEMLYLSDELFKQRDKTMVFRVGTPIDGATLDKDKNEYDIAQEIKSKVYELEPKSDN